MNVRIRSGNGAACCRMAAGSLKWIVQTLDTDRFKAAARCDKFSVNIGLWPASRKIFKTAFDISAADSKF
jgi:hypothetical protein